VTDAIAVRGHLEGMAARLVAEHGVSRQLQGDLQACLDAGDEALLATNPLTYESYAAYAAMNDRFHALILDACGNRALQRCRGIERQTALSRRHRPCCPCRAPSRWTATGCSTPTASTTCWWTRCKAGEGARAQALASGAHRGRADEPAHGAGAPGRDRTGDARHPPGGGRLTQYVGLYAPGVMAGLLPRAHSAGLSFWAHSR
jgi:hypothetical protein